MSEANLKKLSEILSDPLAVDRLAELMPGLVYVFDLPSAQFIYTNQAVSNLIGYGPTELSALGKHLLPTIVHPDDLARTQAHYAHIAQAPPQAVVEIEYRVQSGAQSVRWLHAWEAVLAQDEQGRPRQLLGIAEDVTARAEVEAELRESRKQSSESEKRWRSIAENPFDFVIVIDRDYKFTFVNFVAPGVRMEDLIGKATPLDFVTGDDRAVMEAAFETVFKQGQPTSYEVYVESLQKWYVSLAGPIWEGDVVSQCSVLTRDISHEKLAQAEARNVEEQLRQLEAKLSQAAKLEAVGQLAGGIAHDFNNLLMGIAGVAEALADRVPVDATSGQDILDLRQAIERGAGLTRQLLAFSRQQPVAPVTLDLNALLGETSRMLARLIGEDIELSLLPAKAPLLVCCDRTQLEQVLLNLTVNARDAMVNGGRLAFELSRVELGPNARHEHPNARPGKFARLLVSDTGCGMGEATLSRIFEPFFTTKPIGAGTGLGLAMVHGIVSKAEGFIQVRSELGVGTQFLVHLPLQEGELARPRTSDPPPGGGRETVLLVEDEPLVLRVTRQLLERLGYHVETAARGDEAWARVEAGLVFDLLLTDLRLPGMDGYELYRNTARLRGALPVVFMSGYTDNVLAERGLENAGATFLQKPFSRDDLATKVRAALHAKRAQPASILPAALAPNRPKPARASRP